MGKSKALFLVDGTAALNPRTATTSFPERSFVAFGNPSARGSQLASSRMASPHGKGIVRSAVQSIIERSEMACSLMGEDFRGVPFGKLTTANIASLSIACSVIAAISIAFGA